MKVTADPVKLPAYFISRNSIEDSPNASEDSSNSSSEDSSISSSEDSLNASEDSHSIKKKRLCQSKETFSLDRS